MLAINSELACLSECLVEQPAIILFIDYFLIALVALGLIALLVFRAKLSLKLSLLFKAISLTSFLVLLIVLALTGYGTGLFHYFHQLVLLLIILLFICSYLFSAQIMQFGLIKLKNKKLDLMLSNLAKKFNFKKPGLIVFVEKNPIAFVVSGLKKKIFVSTGLIEMLSENEIKVVLLHELLHLKSSFFTLKRLLSSVKMSFLGLVPINLDELDALEERKLDKKLGAQIKKLKEKLGKK